MAAVFILFKVFAWVVSRLPFPVIYLFSGLVRFLMQYVIRYRKSVIMDNLGKSFPEKSPEEIRELMGVYYRNLADIILEVIKLQHIKPESLKKRFSFTGFAHLEDAFGKGRSVIVAIGHCGNWEWMGTVMGMATPVKGHAIIKPLSDKNFYNYLESIRHRFNPDSTIPFRNTYRTLIRNKREMVTFNVFAADQTPSLGEINYWSKFLNQDTPFYMGVEKLARALDFSVVFIDIQRTARGRYNGDIRLITHEPKNTAEFVITEKYIRFLEEAIRRKPDNWLWSHRRWKFDRNSTEGPVILND